MAAAAAGGSMCLAYTGLSAMSTLCSLARHKHQRFVSYGCVKKPAEAGSKNVSP